MTRKTSIGVLPNRSVSSAVTLRISSLANHILLDLIEQSKTGSTTNCNTTTLIPISFLSYSNSTNGPFYFFAMQSSASR